MTNSAKWVFVGFLEKLNIQLKGEYTNKNGKSSVLVVTDDKKSCFIPKGCIKECREGKNKGKVFITLPKDFPIQMTTSLYNKDTKTYERVSLRCLTPYEFAKTYKKVEPTPTNEDLPF